MGQNISGKERTQKQGGGGSQSFADLAFGVGEKRHERISGQSFFFLYLWKNGTFQNQLRFILRRNHNP